MASSSNNGIVLKRVKKKSDYFRYHNIPSSSSPVKQPHKDYTEAVSNRSTKEITDNDLLPNKPDSPVLLMKDTTEGESPAIAAVEVTSNQISQPGKSAALGQEAIGGERQSTTDNEHPDKAKEDELATLSQPPAQPDPESEKAPQSPAIIKSTSDLESKSEPLHGLKSEFSPQPSPNAFSAPQTDQDVQSTRLRDTPVRNLDSENTEPPSPVPNTTVKRDDSTTERKLVPNDSFSTAGTNSLSRQTRTISKTASFSNASDKPRTNPRSLQENYRKMDSKASLYPSDPPPPPKKVANTVVALVVIMTILEAMWIISEMICVFAVGKQSNSVVWGSVPGSLEKAYIYYAPSTLVVCFAVRHATLMFLRRKYRGTQIVATSPVALLTFDLPIVIIFYYILKCRNLVLLDVQIATRTLHLLALGVRFLLVLIVHARRTTSSALWTLCSFFFIAFLVPIFFLNGLMFTFGSRIQDKDSKLTNVSIVLTPPKSCLSWPVSNTSFTCQDPNGQQNETSTNIDASDFVVVPSLLALAHSNETLELLVTEMKEGDPSDKDENKRYISSTLSCNLFENSGMNVCPDNVTALDFVFLYETDVLKMTKYGQVRFNCAERHTDTCRVGCSVIQDEGWELRFFHVSGKVVDSPWLDVGVCGEATIPEDREHLTMPCSAAAGVVSCNFLSFLLALVTIVRFSL